MFFTLDRIEDNNIAVLTDDNGKVYDIDLSLLPSESKIGYVFTLKDGRYLHDNKETEKRKQRINNKKTALFNKLKNREE